MFSGSGSGTYWKEWRARRDSNPRPSDPKSGSRQSQQLESIRAWNGHREDAVFVDSGVSLDPAPERVLVPSRKPKESDALVGIGFLQMPTTRLRIIRLCPDAFAVGPSADRAYEGTIG